MDSDVDPSRPPPRLLASEYDALVCRDCVLKMPILKKLAGTPGLMMLVSRRESTEWEVIGRLPISSAEEGPQAEGTGVKRKQPDSSELAEDSQPKKAVKLENGRGDAHVTCSASPASEVAQHVFLSVQPTTTSEQKSKYEGAGDVFLAPDFRSKWCQCSDVHFLSLLLASSTNAFSSAQASSPNTTSCLKKKRLTNHPMTLIRVRTPLRC